MISYFILLGLLCTAGILRAALPEPWLAGKGQFRGEIYEVRVDPAARRGTEWNAERDEWPVSFSQAIALARAALTKSMGDDQRHFCLWEVALMRFSSPADDKASWYFLVVFESAHESLITRREVGYSPAVFPFVVFPDGSVILPEKKPNKAPEPTPMSVTPPAAQESRRP